MSGVTTPGTPESPLSILCRGCGLCCDGSLFTHVGLEADELEREQRGREKADEERS